MADYELRIFSVPIDLEEVLTTELWSLGALGFEVHEAKGDRLQLDAYLPSPTPAAIRRFDSVTWRERGVRELSSEHFAKRDWLAEYRASVEPLDIGRGFRIDSRDRVDVDDSVTTAGARRILRIPARTAFGTGSHESTRLMIEWLEELDLTDRVVLDVGTGSGILAFVSEELGARRVVGFDVDPQAICVARTNAQLNRLAPRLFIGDLAAVGTGPRFDLALVNILPENILHQIPQLVRVLVPTAQLISSGNLVSRRDDLLVRWAQCGITPLGEKREGEWVAWLLKSQASGL